MTKLRPSDNGDSEEELIDKQEEKAREQAEEEKNFEDFIKESETDYEANQARKKKELQRLMAERGINPADEEKPDGQVRFPTQIYGEKVKPKKFFDIKQHLNAGIFNDKGKILDFYRDGVQKKMNRALKLKARGVDAKKQREFMQLLEKYQGAKDENQNTMTRGELMRFETGLRTGSSDEQFSKFKEQLVAEGVIKRPEDVKDLFSRRESRRMSDALTGRTDRNPFQRPDRTELINRRMGKNDISGKPSHTAF